MTKRYLTGWIEGVPIYSDDPPFLNVADLAEMSWRWWLCVIIGCAFMIAGIYGIDNWGH